MAADERGLTRMENGTVVSLSTIAAAVGLVLSCLVSAATFFGRGITLSIAFVLQIGAIAAFLGGLAVPGRFNSNFKWEAAWAKSMRTCPRWMRLTLYGIRGYAIYAFIVFAMNAPSKGPINLTVPVLARGWSGLWMVIYSTAMAMLYSADRSKIGSK